MAPQDVSEWGREVGATAGDYIAFRRQGSKLLVKLIPQAEAPGLLATASAPAAAAAGHEQAPAAEGCSPTESTQDAAAAGSDRGKGSGARSVAQASHPDARFAGRKRQRGNDGVTVPALAAPNDKPRLAAAGGEAVAAAGAPAAERPEAAADSSGESTRVGKAAASQEEPAGGRKARSRRKGQPAAAAAGDGGTPAAAAALAPAPPAAGVLAAADALPASPYVGAYALSDDTEGQVGAAPTDIQAERTAAAEGKVAAPGQAPLAAQGGRKTKRSGTRRPGSAEAAPTQPPAVPATDRVLAPAAAADGGAGTSTPGNELVGCRIEGEPGLHLSRLWVGCAGR